MLAFYIEIKLMNRNFISTQEKKRKVEDGNGSSEDDGFDEYIGRFVKQHPNFSPLKMLPKGNRGKPEAEIIYIIIFN